MKNDVHAILKHASKVSKLESISNVLSWDLETQLPVNSSDLRSEQMALIAGIVHTESNRADFVDALFSLDLQKLEAQEKAHVLKLRDQVARSQAVDAAWVEAKAKASTKAQGIWRDARANDRFVDVVDALSQLVKLEQERADRIRAHEHFKSRMQKATRYDALLSEYEPGMNAAELRRVLGQMGDAIQTRLSKILERAKEKAPLRDGSMAMDVSKQQSLGRSIAERMGFDFTRGRLDVSTHPFCGGSPGDVRMTTRYNPSDWAQSFLGVMHETGHALYEQGLPESQRFLPCGVAASFGIHESQSRVWENQVGRSREFLNWLSPQVGLSSAELDLRFNRPELSFIRVEADEVTYNLHILLRMELENDLVEGSLAVKDLAEVWRLKFKELFGVAVPKDSLGCLQDVHWYWGLFGYFPTYSIGNLVAAALFERFCKDNSHWSSEVSTGQLGSFLGFVRREVHQRAAFDDSPSTIEKITGAPFGVDAFVRYVDSKFLT